MQVKKIFSFIPDLITLVRKILTPLHFRKISQANMQSFYQPNLNLQCSVACGSGKQYKNVACVAGDGTQLPEKFCPLSRRPQTIRTCHAGPCITRWFTAEWDKVTFVKKKLNFY